MTTAYKDVAEGDRYILFQTGGSPFVTPLLSIREIVEPLPYRPVPSPYDYFLGLSNLRGQVIGVIDLGIRLKMRAAILAPNPSLIIFEQEGVSFGAYVENVESAVTLDESSIVADALVDMSIPKDALIGVASIGSRFVPVLSLLELTSDSGASRAF